ncbi:hypothetical protein HDV01_007752 [Terramyces sp. JEL0728]|nr:hypothetical protein HDV01_007752 [Terramyces sp. JEL0728]
MPIHKRKIMAYVSMGDTQRAIELLVTYLDTFMQDTEAWVTLGNLYLQTNAFQQALFCYEELVLLRPSTHLYLLKLADLYCAVRKYDIAKKYYLGVVHSLPDCLHAWYGVYYSCKNLKEDGDLFDLAKERILQLAKGPAIQKVYK